MPDPTKTLKRGFFQRLFGKPATGSPSDAGCWYYEKGVVNVDLSRAPELSSPGGAVRIEGETCPERVLLIHGDDNQYHAFQNRCTHGNRRLDPVSGAETVQCCSIGKSTFDYRGALLAGSAKEDITTYPVEVDGDQLVIRLSGTTDDNPGASGD